MIDVQEHTFDAKSARTRQPLPLWVGALSRATEEMDAETLGTYMLILMAMWQAKTCDLLDDDWHLARVARTSATIWRRRFAPIIMPLLLSKNCRISSEKLTEIAEKTEAFCAAQHDKKSGKKPAKPLKENNPTPSGDFPEENHGQTPENPKPLTLNKIKEEKGAGVREADLQKSEPAVSPGFIADLMQAVGVNMADPPRYWLGTGPAEHVARWQAMGLSEEQIITEAKASRAKNTEAPDGPKALDRWMVQAVSNLKEGAQPGKPKAPPKPPASPEDRLAFFADWIAGPKHVPASAVSNTLRDALLHKGLVTAEQLKAKGVST